MSFLSQKFGDTAVVWQKFANARFFPRKFAKARLTKSLERLPTSLPPDIIRWVESALVCGTGIDEILNLEKSREEWSIFFYLELENWMFISRDVLNCQDFEETILVLLSKFKILKNISLLDWMRFCKQILFSRVKILREKTQFLLSILPSISLPILVRNHILLFGWILTSSVLQKGKVF